MIRNGPTFAKIDPDADGKRGAIPTAERGYSLIVNQSEVTAIEAIRLRDDGPEMRLASADDYGRNFTGLEPAECKPEGCSKEQDVAMFQRDFMKCLQALERFKASGGNHREYG